jgi:hypothetical protein
MKPKRPGRLKGTCVIVCRCGHRIAGKPGQSVKCPGCDTKQTVVKRAPPRRKVQMYL